MCESFTARPPSSPKCQGQWQSLQAGWGLHPDSSSRTRRSAFAFDRFSPEGLGPPGWCGEESHPGREDVQFWRRARQTRPLPVGSMGGQCGQVPKRYVWPDNSAQQPGLSLQKTGPGGTVCPFEKSLLLKMSGLFTYRAGDKSASLSRN